MSEDWTEFDYSIGEPDDSGEDERWRWWVGASVQGDAFRRSVCTAWVPHIGNFFGRMLDQADQMLHKGSLWMQRHFCNLPHSLNRPRRLRCRSITVDDSRCQSMTFAVAPADHFECLANFFFAVLNLERLATNSSSSHTSRRSARSHGRWPDLCPFGECSKNREPHSGDHQPWACKQSHMSSPAAHMMICPAAGCVSEPSGLLNARTKDRKF